MKIKFTKYIILSIAFPLFMFSDISTSFSERELVLAGERAFDPGIITAQDIKNSLSNFSEFKDFESRLERFLDYWGVTGASVAIAKEGKVIYAKGFGYANSEAEEAMEPYHIMRVASISKLITAVAVMQLQEKGLLNIDMPVFGRDGILNDTKYLDYIDPRVESITVKHLLNHSAGWTTRWGDHLFMNESIARQLGKPLPLSQDDIISFALSRRLHFTPGNHSSYNNIGYIILERIIEKVSRQKYERYAQQHIFAPINVFDAFLAFNYDSLRFPLEVRYYEVPEAELVSAYDGSSQFTTKSRGGNDVRTLGGAGGWVISAVSLAKFLMAIEGVGDFKKIISDKSASYLAQSQPGIHPSGWRWVSSMNKKIRTGSFSGTSALSVVNSDGLIYVFISNSSPWVGARFPYNVDKFFTTNLSRIENWPQADLLDPEYHKKLLAEDRGEGVTLKGS